MRARLVLIAFGCAVAAAASGCVGLPHADAADVERAQKRWPGTDAQSLEQGREMYVRKCGGCHTLYLPESRSPHQWPQLVEEMSREGGISDHERELIEQFLVTMSERAQSQQPQARTVADGSLSPAVR